VSEAGGLRYGPPMRGIATQSGAGQRILLPPFVAPASVARRFRCRRRTAAVGSVKGTDKAILATAAQLQKTRRV
jgi:hypothetical protein